MPPDVLGFVVVTAMLGGLGVGIYAAIVRLKTGQKNLDSSDRIAELEARVDELEHRLDFHDERLPDIPDHQRLGRGTE